jgi:hypothetical protein
MVVRHMVNHELHQLLMGKAGLWLAGIAACAGLALAWRWWMSHRVLRNKALRVLGFTQSRGLAIGPGVRYAGVIAAALVTIFALTPTTPGIGDAAPTPDATPPVATEPASDVVVVELRSDDTFIVVRGGDVEIHLAPAATTPQAVEEQSAPGTNVAPFRPTATPRAWGLPAGME